MRTQMQPLLWPGSESRGSALEESDCWSSARQAAAPSGRGRLAPSRWCQRTFAPERQRPKTASPSSWKKEPDLTHLRLLEVSGVESAPWSPTSGSSAMSFIPPHAHSRAHAAVYNAFVLTPLAGMGVGVSLSTDPAEFLPGSSGSW